MGELGMTEEYKEGWKALCSGIKKCPYEKGTKEAKRWWAGWFDCNNDPTRLSEASVYLS